MAVHIPTGVFTQLTRGTEGFLLPHLTAPLSVHLHRNVRALEAHAEKAGISSWTLMRRAGTATWKLLRARWPHVSSLTVLCGGGNNGGDGYVAAVLAAQFGWKVRLIECGGRGKLSPAAARARAWAMEAKPQVQDSANWDAASDDSELFLDALLGTGLKDEVREVQQQALCKLRQVRAPIVAVDLPSGLDADTGCALAPVARADATLTFIAGKVGLWTGVGREHSGAIYLADLQLPTELFSKLENEAYQLLGTSSLRSELPPVPAHAHKGMLGKVLIAGGDEGMAGAAILAAEAALRCGAGLVTAAVAASAVSPLLARRPEVMAHDIANGQDLEPLLQRAQQVVLGPGLGSGSRAQQFVQRTLARAMPGDCRLVIDAGALRLLTGKELPADTVLTPHPAEMAALLGCTTAQIGRDRPAAARKLSEQMKAVVILKGAGTLIAAHGRLCGICPSGNSGMATAGSGDVLSGIIGALLARGMSPLAAAKLAVAAHAEAGDRVALLGGVSSLVAADLIRPAAALLDGC